VISIFAIIGAINIPIIKFSVNWWNTLHQGPSITSSGSAIAGEFLTILILMVISLLFLSYAIFARNIQSEILLRTRQSKRLQGEING
jgi:heme exporter protein C